MPVEKTPKQISDEIKSLRACKAYAPHYTVFGDDNHRKIDLQIEFLRGDIDVTADEFEDDYSDDEKSAILEAQNWQEGWEKESPSAGWDMWKNKHAAQTKGKKK